MDVSAPPVWLISGEIGAGKTALCRALASRARAAGWDVAGLLSPGVFAAGQKTAIQVEDLRSGARRLLASAEPRAGFDLAFGRWHFDRAVLAWGNQVLEESAPCDLLMVDELGPLELLLGQGFSAAQAVLAGGRYRVGIAAVRPALVETFSALLPPQRVVAPGSSSSSEQQAASLWGAIIGLSAVSNALY
jgi:nucleoside-triphosphatase THEP1